MITGPLIAEIAGLVGEPARATMLSALLDGRALTATELAYAARITPQTASTHLEADGGRTNHAAAGWSIPVFPPRVPKGRSDARRNHGRRAPTSTALQAFIATSR